MKKYVEITGSGVGDLAAACLLKNADYDVTFTDTLEIQPDYQIFFKGTLLGAVTLTGISELDETTLEALEPGARQKLARFRKSSMSFTGSTSVYKQARRHFSSVELQKIMQFPFVLLGLDPRTTPAPKFATYHYQHLPRATSHGLTINLDISTTYNNLASHNIILSKDWETMLHSTFRTGQWPADPTVYVGAPTDRQLRIEVPLPITKLYTDEELTRYVDWLYEIIESSLHLRDLRAHIVSSKVTGPKRT